MHLSGFLLGITIIYILLFGMQSQAEGNGLAILTPSRWISGIIKQVPDYLEVTWEDA